MKKMILNYIFANKKTAYNEVGLYATYDLITSTYLKWVQNGLKKICQVGCLNFHMLRSNEDLIYLFWPIELFYSKIIKITCNLILYVECCIGSLHHGRHQPHRLHLGADQVETVYHGTSFCYWWVISRLLLNPIFLDCQSNPNPTQKCDLKSKSKSTF